MNNIKKILEYIVPKTIELNRLYIAKDFGEINYSAIFCQSDKESEELKAEASGLGQIIQDTPTGPLFKLNEAIKTPAGNLWLLKIRQPDSTRTQRGHADFTLKDYNSFKEKYLKDESHFKLIDRGSFEMIELRDFKFDVLSYFSSIPLVSQLKIK
ncbi:MAG: hypothetical protein WC508_03690 [Patescibacteria group bacterium]